MPVRRDARGRPGHASWPSSGDNALVKLGPAIERLAGASPERRAARPSCWCCSTRSCRAMTRSTSASRAPRELHPELPGDARAAAGLDRLADHDRGLDALNVIPAHAELRARLSRAARHRAGRAPARAARVPRRHRRRARARRPTRGRLALARRHAARGHAPRLRRDRRPRRAGAALDERAASRTRTTCARPTAPSRTASSRCCTHRSSSPPRPCTRTTSGSTRTTSPLACASSSMHAGRSEAFDD